MLAALIAALAAFTATFGDLLMLYVSNGRRPELSLPAVPSASLWVGAVLGVLAIPFYALGYHSASRMMGAVPRGAAGAVFSLGAIGALLGAMIHGLTALQIHADLEAGIAAQDPLSSVARWGPSILVLWTLAGASVLLASVLFAWSVTRGKRSAARVAWTTGKSEPGSLPSWTVPSSSSGVSGRTMLRMRSARFAPLGLMSALVFVRLAIWMSSSWRRSSRLFDKRSPPDLPPKPRAGQRRRIAPR